jgi:hypothetical protein
VCIIFFTAETIEDAKTYLEEYKNKMDTDKIVVKPSHYERWDIEPVTFIMINNMEFWRGNIIKYAARAGYKDYVGLNTKPEEVINSEIIDLQKVIRYAEMRINQLQEKEITDHGTR